MHFARKVKYATVTTTPTCALNPMTSVRSILRCQTQRLVLAGIKASVSLENFVMRMVIAEYLCIVKIQDLAITRKLR